MPITVTVFQDTACPWCRIGKRHLAQSLQRWQGEAVEVIYRSYFLQPNLPPEGADFAQVMGLKSGGRLPLESWFEGPRRMGAAAGLTFHFEKITRAPNTLLSHRLIALAPETARPALIDAIYAAYFEFGQDIGDQDTLLDLAGACGMDPAETRRLLASDAAQEQVLADDRWARQAGISGVPFFIFNDRYALSGAQPPETFLEVLTAIQDGTIDSKTKS